MARRPSRQHLIPCRPPQLRHQRLRLRVASSRKSFNRRSVNSSKRMRLHSPARSRHETVAVTAVAGRSTSTATAPTVLTPRNLGLCAKHKEANPEPNVEKRRSVRAGGAWSKPTAGAEYRCRAGRIRVTRTTRLWADVRGQIARPTTPQEPSLCVTSFSIGTRYSGQQSVRMATRGTRFSRTSGGCHCLPRSTWRGPGR